MQKHTLTLLFLVTSAFAQSTPSSIPGLSVSPASIEFDDTDIQTSSLQEVTISNTSSSTITVQTSVENPSFAMTTGAPCETLAPQESCTFTASFSPETLGRESGKFRVHTDIGDVAMSLTGFGVQPATNDSITNAFVLPTTFNASVTTRIATTDVDDPRPTACESTDDSRIQTVWYRFHPTTKGWLQIDTRGSDFDTLVSVWSGSPGALTLNACDDNEKSGVTTSLLALPVSDASDYYIMVAGKTSSDTGILTFNSVFETDQAIKQQEVTTGTIAPGQSSTFKVIAQFEGDTNLSVAVSPATATISCAATPNQLQFYGSGESRYSIINVKCTTVGPNASLTLPPSSRENWQSLLLAGSCLAIFVAGLNKRTMLLAVFAAVLLLGSCGGGGGTTAASSSPPPPTTPSGGTPGGSTGGESSSTAPGTYTVTLTGSPKQVVSSPMTLVVR